MEVISEASVEDREEAHVADREEELPLLDPSEYWSEEGEQSVLRVLDGF